MGAWPKGITVGNWREGGYTAQSLIHSYSFISTAFSVPPLNGCRRLLLLRKNNYVWSLLGPGWRLISTIGDTTERLYKL